MESDKRRILKSFNCIKCINTFKKCVSITDNESNCPKCNHKCKESPMSSIAEKMKKIQAKQSKERRSPFYGSVTRSHHNLSFLFKENLFEINKEFFIDNFASNFTSNFQNPMTRIVFIKSRKEESNVKPLKPLFIRQLFDMKMSEIYCKELHCNGNSKGEEGNKGGYEYPTCMICLRDIEQDGHTMVIKCGHLFHYDCIVQMLKKHGICPVCKYDLTEEITTNNNGINEECNNNSNSYINITNNFKHSQSHNHSLCYSNGLNCTQNDSYFNTNNDNDTNTMTKQEHDMIYNDQGKTEIEGEEIIMELIHQEEEKSNIQKQAMPILAPNKIFISINKALSAQNINIYGNQKAIIS